MASTSNQQTITLGITVTFDEDAAPKYFDDWAKGEGDDDPDYDTYTRMREYRAPQRLVELALPYFGRANVLDVGAGTGQVGAILSAKGFTVDGIDFSSGMLEKAKNSGYRQLVQGDITRQVDIEKMSKRYKNVISVGVFGDYQDPIWLLFLESILRERSTLAIAGKADDLNDNLEDTLAHMSFEIRERHLEFGHKFSDETDIEYLYVVATR